MSFNNDTWRQCYYGTNIAPQAGLFNQQGWRILEGMHVTSEFSSDISAAFTRCAFSFVLTFFSILMLRKRVQVGRESTSSRRSCRGALRHHWHVV
jgi:hypothetical protein